MNDLKKRLLVSTFADPTASPRPRRMIERSLEAGFNVDLFSLEPSSEFKIGEQFSISKSNSKWLLRRKVAAIAMGLGFPILRSKRLREWLIRVSYGLGNASRPFEGKRFDLVIVEDLFLLPYCLNQANGAPIIFDAREFYPKQREGEFLFEVFERPIRDWVCKTFLSQCSKVFTVSTGLADAYKNQYNIDTTLLRSTPNYIECPASESSISEDTIRLVHLGGANPNRKIEKMIEVFSKLESRFTFDLYLSGSQTYIAKLRLLALGLERINIQDPVAPNEIIETLINYDIGFYYLEPNGFNLKHCLPNKFFEFIQARLAIVIGPSPDMKHLLDEFQCGFASSEFSIESMAETLNALTNEQITEARKKSGIAAKALCAENEWLKLDQALEELCP